MKIGEEARIHFEKCILILKDLPFDKEKQEIVKKDKAEEVSIN